MVLRLVIALIVVAAIILALRWFARTPAPQVARALRRVAVTGGILLLIYLAASGRLHWLYALIGSAVPIVYRLSVLLGLLPLIQRLLSLKQTLKSAAGPGDGQSSAIQTRYLRMSLDHDTGAMDGEVLEGRFAGRQLNQMRLDELLLLLDECQAHDEQSVAVLRAYLDRVHGDNWQDRHAWTNAEQTDGSHMTRAEAYEILGLAPGAATEEIINAHRRLMQKLHPDRGGSTYLAAKLNQAKDLLLAK
ncbi:MAG: DnaJ domain-containing protein [Acidiferrobacterales bacterium]|nr:DnaJ domain-containing protein [Acidiferrobacterales bacterium]